MNSISDYIPNEEHPNIDRLNEITFPDSDVMISRIEHSLSRIYIPRIMFKQLGLQTTFEIKNVIYWVFNQFANISYININWLERANDYEAFIYLDFYVPLKKMNLQCMILQKKMIIHFKNSFWKCLPFYKYT
jgi:hypothetical protein